jgi:hypothetical protein
MRTYFAVRAIYMRDVARHKPQSMMIQSSANILTDKRPALLSCAVVVRIQYVLR